MGTVGVTFAPTTFLPTTMVPVPTFEPTVTDRPTESPTTFLPTTTHPPTTADTVPLVETGAEGNLTTTTLTPSYVPLAPPTPTAVPEASPVQDWTDPVPVVSGGATTAVLSSSIITAAVGLLVVNR